MGQRGTNGLDFGAPENAGEPLFGNDLEGDFEECD